MKQSINTIYSNKNFFNIVFATIICLYLFWIINLNLYPFIDLPNHLFAAEVYNSLGEIGNSFDHFYSISTLLKSNTFHFFFVQLPFFPDIESGNKIFYFIYIVFLPLSVFLLIKKLNGDTRFAILSILLVFNFSVIWGFTGYTISIPAILFFVLLLIDFIEYPKWTYVGLLMILLLLIFIMHFQSALFAIMLLFVFGLYEYKNLLMNLHKKILIILPSLILMFIAWDSDKTGHHQSLITYLKEYYISDFFLGYYWRFPNIFVLDNYFLFEKTAGIIIAVFLTAVIILPFALFLIYNRSEFKTIFLNGYNRFAFLFLFSSLFCYLFLPNNLPGQNMVYERFTTFVLLGFIICSSILLNFRKKEIYIKVILIISLLYAVILTHYFYEFKQESKVFSQELFPKNTGNKVLAGLIHDYEFRGQPVYIHFQTYNTIWNKNISTNGWMDYRFGLLRRKVTMDELPPHIAWIKKVNPYNDEYKKVNYILLKDDTLRTISNFKLINSSGDWHLYENISDSIYFK